MACFLGIVPWVEAVLAKKIWRTEIHKRINEQDSDGATALHWAAKKRNKTVVWLLIDKGADVEVKNRGGGGERRCTWQLMKGIWW